MCVRLPAGAIPQRRVPATYAGKATTPPPAASRSKRSLIGSSSAASNAEAIEQLQEEVGDTQPVATGCAHQPGGNSPESAVLAGRHGAQGHHAICHPVQPAATCSSNPWPIACSARFATMCVRVRAQQTGQHVAHGHRDVHQGEGLLLLQAARHRAAVQHARRHRAPGEASNITTMARAATHTCSAATMQPRKRSHMCRTSMPP